MMPTSRMQSVRVGSPLMPIARHAASALLRAAASSASIVAGPCGKSGLVKVAVLSPGA